MEDLVGGFWARRSVFVTGASGLVGGWVTRALLAAGARLTVLLRDRVPGCQLVREGLLEQVAVVHGDLVDQPLLERALAEYEADTVIHLAAQAIVGVANRQPVGTFEANIRGTWTLLEACRRTPRVGALVVASSDKAYGAQPVLPYDESMPLRGAHPYDVSKACADLLAQSYAATYDLPVAVTRCGNLFGGGDLNWNRIIPGTIRSLLAGERPVVRSDGQFVRDYLYVEDGAQAYLTLAQQLAERPELRGRAFNFSYEQPLTVLEVVDRVRRLMGSNLEPDVRNEASHEIREQYLSAARARAELGWAPAYDLDEGLRRTVGWYRGFLGG